MPELVRGRVLGWRCCPERQIRDCFCARAQEWRRLAAALLEQCNITSGVTTPRKKMLDWEWQDFSLLESSVSTNRSKEVKPTWIDQRGQPRYSGKKVSGGLVPQKRHRLSNVTGNGGRLMRMDLHIQVRLVSSVVATSQRQTLAQ